MAEWVPWVMVFCAGGLTGFAVSMMLRTPSKMNEAHDAIFIDKRPSVNLAGKGAYLDPVAVRSVIREQRQAREAESAERATSEYAMIPISKHRAKQLMDDQQKVIDKRKAELKHRVGKMRAASNEVFDQEEA